MEGGLPGSSNSAGILIDGSAAPKLVVESRSSRQPTASAAVPIKPVQTRIAKLVV